LHQLLRSHDHPEQVLAARGDAVTTAAPPAALRLLLVEDDAVDRIAVRRALRDGELAAEVVEVGTVADALIGCARAPSTAPSWTTISPTGRGSACWPARPSRCPRSCSRARATSGSPST